MLPIAIGGLKTKLLSIGEISSAGSIASSGALVLRSSASPDFYLDPIVPDAVTIISDNNPIYIDSGTSSTIIVGSAGLSSTQIFSTNLTANYPVFTDTNKKLISRKIETADCNFAFLSNPLSTNLNANSNTIINVPQINAPSGSSLTIQTTNLPITISAGTGLTSISGSGGASVRNIQLGVTGASNITTLSDLNISAQTDIFENSVRHFIISSEIRLDGSNFCALTCRNVFGIRSFDDIVRIIASKDISLESDTGKVSIPGAGGLQVRAIRIGIAADNKIDSTSNLLVEAAAALTIKGTTQTNITSLSGMLINASDLTISGPIIRLGGINITANPSTIALATVAQSLIILPDTNRNISLITSGSGQINLVGSSVNLNDLNLTTTLSAVTIAPTSGKSLTITTPTDQNLSIFASGSGEITISSIALSINELNINAIEDFVTLRVYKNLSIVSGTNSNVNFAMIGTGKINITSEYDTAALVCESGGFESRYLKSYCAPYLNATAAGTTGFQFLTGNFELMGSIFQSWTNITSNYSSDFCSINAATGIITFTNPVTQLVKITFISSLRNLAGNSSGVTITFSVNGSLTPSPLSCLASQIILPNIDSQYVVEAIFSVSNGTTVGLMCATDIPMAIGFLNSMFIVAPLHV